MVLSRGFDLVRFATDASPYRMFPQVVVLARDVQDVQRVLAYGHAHSIPVTFRAAGTSLSGQSQGDGILVEVMRHWIGCTVEDGGRTLRSKPGTILARANAALKRHGYRLGPDPASKAAATIGGVVANNASGMCCGTVENSYQTLRSMTIVLPSGTVLDTAAPDAEEHLAQAEPAIAAGLREIRDAILADPATADRIRTKFRIKNTTGYSMNAFLDSDTPVQILRRLMVGSEGTLGFIAEAVFDTVRDDAHHLTSLMLFPDMEAACSAVAPFVAAGAAAVELMDRASIAAVRGRPGVPARWDDLPAAATGLLVEFRDESARAVRGVRGRGRWPCSAAWTLLEPTTFTRDAELAAQYWVIRNGLLASVGGARPSGTSFILEDVCFPPERLAEGALALQELFARHDYDAVIFGHASAGNLHFLVTPWLRDAADVERFDAFLRDVVAVVTRAVRRVAQGRARHGAQHRTVRRDRVGRDDHRAHARGQGADRPARGAVPGRGAHRRPAGPPPAPEDRPDHRGDRRPLHRVRLLRERVPEPSGHHHAPAAHRPAPGDGAPAGGVTRGRGAGRRLRLRRGADLRRRRDMRARLPGGDQHRRPDEGVPGEGPSRARPGHRADRGQAVPADAARGPDRAAHRPRGRLGDR